MAAVIDTHPKIRETESSKFTCEKCGRSYQTKKRFLIHSLRSISCGTKRDVDFRTIIPPNTFGVDFVNKFGEHLFDPSKEDPKKTAITQIVIQHPLDFYEEIKRYLWSFAPNQPTPDPPQEFTEIMNGETITEYFDSLITNFIHEWYHEINRAISKHSRFQLANLRVGTGYVIVIPIADW
ncbi:MAG: hypothetical protein M0R33_22325 [Methylomonas sp.]|jgi:hypothetical protein|uniref:hypothetical protein n=1 Tax=Methylomonas sp. TaxID=418 RepID=UPI0025CBB394|nr:hypothetical protein [Methylomonas sp.]MCK9609181.1 hypothetical protein [Methylomonas sp.]